MRGTSIEFSPSLTYEKHCIVFHDKNKTKQTKHSFLHVTNKKTKNKINYLNIMISIHPYNVSNSLRERMVVLPYFHELS